MNRDIKAGQAEDDQRMDGVYPSHTIVRSLPDLKECGKESSYEY